MAFAREAAMDGGWVLLPRGLESKHNRQPSQATMRPARMGRKLFKYLAKQGCAKVYEQPEIIASSSPLAKQSCLEKEVCSPTAVDCPTTNREESTIIRDSCCFVPSHFSLSPSGSPRTAADFMEPFTPPRELPLSAGESSYEKEFEFVQRPQRLTLGPASNAIRMPSNKETQAEPDGMRQRHPSSSKARVLASVSPEIARHGSMAVKEEIDDKDTRCFVPEYFSLSPSGSPRTAADFVEPFIPDVDLQRSSSELSVEREFEFVSRPQRPPEGQLPNTTRMPSQKAASYESRGMRHRKSSQPTAAVLASHATEAARHGPIALRQERIDGFVLVSPTPATAARRFACDHPRMATGLLWAWFVLLILGELATTFWWFYCIGFRGLLVLSAPLFLGGLLGLFAFGHEQMIAIAIAVSLAAMPAMPAYSAVLLIMPPSSSLEQPGTCWSILHWPLLALLGITYFISAVVPAVRAENTSPCSFTPVALQSLETAQKLAQSACVMSAWLYAGSVIHVGATNLLAGRQHPTATSALWHFSVGSLSDPLFKGRGLILTLHFVGLLCATARQRTVKQLGEDLLPRLFGAKRAKELTPLALFTRHGRKLLKGVPRLRHYTPPTMVVALVVAVRRTAPVLFPLLAILPQLARPGAYGWPTLPLLLGFMMLAVLAIAAANEQRALPSSSLRRLPLLLPRGVAPCTRKLLGYGLVVADGVERVRSGFTSARSQMRRAGSALMEVVAQ